ncbi:MAG: hypothetical protein K0U24_03725 [Gammaproteobacteria bacterium]|nr:hypothetical protein [Gammaproteobacteria bacterium]MCH9718056.1 hypothetical protein [Gammaproteobacteria bacterium]MCH9763325.1 hypothetical protein [Gammaproteobacteria bacterium]
MCKQMLWLIGGIILLFSFELHARVCGSHEGCNQWRRSHCSCGVAAKCIGVSQHTASGACQCLGAEGVCDSTADDGTLDAHDMHAIPVRAKPARRTPIRRNVIRGNKAAEAEQ